MTYENVSQKSGSSYQLSAVPPTLALCDWAVVQLMVSMMVIYQRRRIFIVACTHAMRLCGGAWAATYSCTCLSGLGGEPGGFMQVVTVAELSIRLEVPRQRDRQAVRLPNFRKAGLEPGLQQWLS